MAQATTVFIFVDYMHLHDFRFVVYVMNVQKKKTLANGTDVFYCTWLSL